MSEATPRAAQANRDRARTTTQGQVAGLAAIFMLLPTEYQAPSLAAWTVLTQVMGKVARDRIEQGHTGIGWLILAQLG